MTINSGSSSSTTTNTSKRISGLASGMDTESLVKDLTSPTQSKIDSAFQQKQILEWKQEYYQEIATKLNDFNNKYFSSTSSIVDKLQTLTSASSNASYVTAIAGSSASSGSIYIDDIQSLATVAKLKGTNTISPAMSFAVDADLTGLSGSKMNITLDGVTKTVTFQAGVYNSSTDAASALQTLVNNAFGSNRISVSGADGNLSFSAGTSKLSISDTSAQTDSQALLILGFDNTTDVSSNRLSLSNTTLSSMLNIGDADEISFSINNKTFTFTGSTSLSSVLSNINSSDANVKISYSDVSDSFSISSKETGSGSKVDISDSTGSFLQKIMGNDYGTLTNGTDAIVKLSLDGSTDESSLITLTRSTNSFTANGVSFTLNTMAAGTAKEQVSINTAVNSAEILSTITSFVDDYNSLLKSVTDKLNEKKYKDYLPLTDAQKEDLSDSEIKKWTDFAKSGLLRNDSALTQIYSQLRNCMYSSVSTLDGSGDTIGTVLSDIGITTGTYTEYGKLTVNKDKLLSSINQNIDGVLKLFTQKSSVSFSVYNSEENKTKRASESGLLYKLSDILKSNLNSTGAKGNLISLIGNPTTQFKGLTTYSKKITDIAAFIDKLEDKLEDQQDFYFKKFTSMETAINSLNSQAAWLSQT